METMVNHFSLWRVSVMMVDHPDDYDNEEEVRYNNNSKNILYFLLKMCQINFILINMIISVCLRMKRNVPWP